MRTPSTMTPTSPANARQPCIGFGRRKRMEGPPSRGAGYGILTVVTIRETQRLQRSYACAQESPAILVANRIAASRLAEAGVEIIDVVARAFIFGHVLERRDELGEAV